LTEVVGSFGGERFAVLRLETLEPGTFNLNVDLKIPAAGVEKKVLDKGCWVV
jgi:hypothetical protein